MKTKKEDVKVQLETPKSYSRFEKCIMLLIAKFFSKEKDIKKFGKWLEKYLKEGDDKMIEDNEDLIKWNKQSEKDLYEVASRTWDFNRYLCILKNGNFALATSICDEAPDGSVSCYFEFCDEEFDGKYYVDDIEYWVLLEKPKGETK